MPETYVIEALREGKQKRQRLNDELAQLRVRADADPDDQGVAERISNLSAASRKVCDEINELEDEIGKYGHLRSLAGNPQNREAGMHREDHTTPDHPAGNEPSERRQAAFAEAQAVLEDHLRSGELSSMAADHVDAMLRGDDVHVGVDAQYIASVGQRAYATAFAKMLAAPHDAIMRMTDDEREAFQQVVRAQEFRAMAENAGSTGGFGIPLTIDPSINLLSDGSVNPIRDLATVRTISTRELRLLTSDGASMSYAAEGTEVADTGPPLSQPDVFVERLHGFVPFSYEIGMDWNGLLVQLQDLFVDAKDQLENAKFLSGQGHAQSEPAGLLGGATGSLTSSQEILSGGSGSFAVSDVYAMREAIPPRFLPNATWVCSPTLQDLAWRLVVRASTTENTLMPDREHILELPLRQWSAMATTISSGSVMAIVGDFKKGVTVVDRIGMQAEIVPMLFGSANRYPTGQRGMYLFGRNSMVVMSTSTNKCPLRYLQSR